MFSQFVTAAKGLFARQDSTEELPGDADKPNPTSRKRSKSATPKTPKMVTATRRGRIETPDKEASPEVNGNGTVNGKRKAESASSAKTDAPSGKRRKRTSLAQSERLEDIETQQKDNTKDALENGGAEEKHLNGGEEKSNFTSEEKTASNPARKETASAGKANHFRFGSEEPTPVIDGLVEAVPETQQDNAQASEESDDDEAPEAFDNSAQLSRMKAEAQKQEQARQKAELLKREKRRQLDELHKSQAKTTNKKKKDPIEGIRKAEYQDDLLSESTATLQGSITQDIRRSALPALLPDEILNAAPIVRPPTPPPEDGPKKPNKLKFLDTVEKPPKDLKRGGTTVRVLEGSMSGKKTGNTLAPKVSKAGRNVRETWLAGKRTSVADINGLRRTNGGTSGFVRSR